ncbi:aldose epimerase [Aggregicoccus sp. 17bor-14]|uniref:aldose epimerase family protein n=1 Tax=Myxococcaceae TaxID=31 RepID=UPI00129C9EE8|nr:MULTISPECIES: aldose epimerase [Myxococcaceae]MBF5044647.1 aldose epimerase [Simulacricoccus sp. 17bor-14]MRI90391.1 aldose epimerase [Aggregicoccus sp. 17bor-14]
MVTLVEGPSRAEIVPERGALVSRFSVASEPVLFLDERTLADPKKSVRGGIPLLFPSPGVIPGGKYAVDGREVSMRKHGFARDLPWTLEAQEADRAVLRLESSEQTRREFPWDFEARLFVRLQGPALHLAFQVKNRDARRMPLHLGMHPYFYVPQPQKAHVRIETDATRAFDNLQGRERPFQGFPLEDPEVDLHLLDHSPHGTVVHRGQGLRPVRLAWSPEFHTMVVWTLGGRDFVCVEPWTARGGALKTGEGLLWLAPGETRALQLSIAV